MRRMARRARGRHLIGFVVATLGLSRCTPAADTSNPPRLVNDDFRIVEMATAHGAFTIEVEVAPGGDTMAIARTLIEPLQARYAEVLVYFYRRDDPATLPLSRVQWTATGGFREVTYPASRTSG